MSASEHREVRRTLPGRIARVGGMLAGLTLALGIQPFVASAHTHAAEHYGLYNKYMDDAGIVWGHDRNGNQPGDQALLTHATDELDTVNNYEFLMLGGEAGALALLSAGIIAGRLVGRRQETGSAVWHAATHAVPTGE